MEMPFRSPKDSPRRTRRSGRTWLVALAVGLPLATGCAANFSAQTQQQYQPAAGSDSRVGDVWVLNALVVADDSGDGTLVVSLLNQQSCPDYLVDLQVTGLSGGGVESSQLPAAESVPAPDGCDSSAPDTGITLPPREPAKLPDGANVQVHADSVAPGTFLTMKMRFQNAAPVELDVPVFAPDQTYKDIPVGPIETPQTTGSATPAN